MRRNVCASESVIKPLSASEATRFNVRLPLP